MGPHRIDRLLEYLEEDGGVITGRLDQLRLSSHYQPIYSLSHARVVGHEALLRARDHEDRFVSPLDVFNGCKTPMDLAVCDSLSRLVHMANFTASRPKSQWLFLNVHPDVFQLLCKRGNESGDAYMRTVFDHFGIQGESLVLEVLESTLSDLPAFEAAMAMVRSHGCLIAIDDFGAGHSNFDRVWRLQPDIVKLDRSLVVRAARDRRAQRVVSQMVSLLHECGSMVLMEGIETAEEALLAMEADVDMVQGYFFGRPQPALIPTGHVPGSITQLYAGLSERRREQREQHRDRIAPYRHAIGNAGILLSGGHSMADACRSFLELPGAELCYVLDAEGYQIGNHLRSEQADLKNHVAYEPLRGSAGACWSRRPYFRRAIENVGRVQITRPYRTLHGNHTCVTASFAYLQLQADGSKALRVVCGDLVWLNWLLDMDDGDA
jgi:EAL domain-containing protein (putative c-di-GMP-specific phosphodiesterase class I)